MKTQEELRADFQRYFEADMLDEAEAVLDLIQPVSDEEFQKILDEAPQDDEPLTHAQRARLDRLRAIVGLPARQRAG